MRAVRVWWMVGDSVGGWMGCFWVICVGSGLVLRGLDGRWLVNDLEIIKSWGRYGIGVGGHIVRLCVFTGWIRCTHSVRLYNRHTAMK